MLAPKPLPPPLSIEAFLAFIDAHPGQKWELIDGQPEAMGGATLRHAMIGGNIAFALEAAARAKNCRILRDMFLRAAANDELNQVFDPDVMIRCGPPRDLADRIIDDPRAVFEVLSPSTMARDRGVKFEAYQRTASVEQIVLIYPTERRLESWRREPGGPWPEAPDVLKRADAALAIPLIDAALPLTVIYEGVDLAD